MPDLVIRAGLVLDGTGNPPTTADIAIREGKIAEVGRVRDRAHRILDADGALVIPGLLALLPPADVARFDRNRTAHRAPGITTTVETVPRSDAPQELLPELLAGVDKMQLIVDRAFLIDHGQMRREVMGNKVRDQIDASEGDRETMAGQVAAAFAAGVVGLRSSVEGRPDELVRILELAATQILAETETEATYSLLLAGDREPGEVLEMARYLDRALTISSIVVAGSEPFDDGSLTSALVPQADADLASLWAVERTIAGPAINPLALLGAASDETFPLTVVGLRWAAAFDAFGLADRGRIASDLRADINILDHVHLSDDLTGGVVSTLVNGVEIVNFDELTGASPGQLAVSS